MHRMTMQGYDDFNKYLIYLGNHPGELQALLDTVTIHVTGFFRDKDVFRTLVAEVFPKIIEHKTSIHNRVIRIWSAGCSTGEEAYSITMVLMEVLRERGVDFRIETFGSDISEEACKTARKGVYQDCKIVDLPRHMRERYFEHNGDHYTVSSDIRSLVRFRIHDLFSKPPYSMLDLILCRNVMIHFDHQVRGTIIRHFHSALNDTGFLMLGKSEAVAEPELDLFELFAARSKIYRKEVLQAVSKEDHQ